MDTNVLKLQKQNKQMKKISVLIIIKLKKRRIIDNIQETGILIFYKWQDDKIYKRHYL